MRVLSSAESFFALALPPFSPASLPKRDFPASIWPVEIATMRAASAFASRGSFFGFCTPQNMLERFYIRELIFKLSHYPSREFVGKQGGHSRAV